MCKLNKFSRYLIKLLRHKAIEYGFAIDNKGFVSLNDILHAHPLFTFNDIKEIVQTDDKKRFELVEIMNEWYIRAVQGHSIEGINPDLKLIMDPNEIPVVVHGTNLKAYEIIQHNGLSKMGRTYIHFAQQLSSDENVVSGIRKNSTVLIYINVQKAMDAGIKFYQSSNGVILSDGIEGIIEPKFFAQIDFADE